MKWLVRLADLSRRIPPFPGKTRLQAGLFALAQRGRSGPPWVAARIGGVAWELDIAEVIQAQIFWEGGYGKGVLAWLARQAQGAGTRGGATFWDVGANVGAVSFFMAARCPGLAVESFEPSPRVFAKLARHAALNPGLAVRLNRLALSDTTGTSLFHESAERFNGGVGALYAARNNEANAVAVEVARGDELVASGRVAPPTLIKIDVEGFELEVLGGLATVLGRHRPPLCVESAGPRLAARGRPLDAIGRRLAELGYRVACIDEVSGEERPLTDADWARNIDLAAHPI